LVGKAALDVVDGVLHRAKPANVVAVDVDVELLFQRERQLYECKRIGAEVIHEAGRWLEQAAFSIEMPPHDELHLRLRRCL